MAKMFKGAGVKMAKLAGESVVMDVAAEKIRARAQSTASTRMRTGRFSQAFDVKRAKGRGGVTDRVVVNEHPDALAIELGHFANHADGTPGRFVPGQFNLLRAVHGS